MTPARRATDASKLTFPLQMVIAIVGMFVSALGGSWLAIRSIDGKVDSALSHIAVIDQQLKDAAQLETVKGQLEQERSAGLKEAIAAITRQQQVLAYEQQALKEMVLKEGSHVQR